MPYLMIFVAICPCDNRLRASISVELGKSCLNLRRKMLSVSAACTIPEGTAEARASRLGQRLHHRVPSEPKTLLRLQHRSSNYCRPLNRMPVTGFDLPIKLLRQLISVFDLATVHDREILRQSFRIDRERHMLPSVPGRKSQLDDELRPFEPDACRIRKRRKRMRVVARKTPADVCKHFGTAFVFECRTGIRFAGSAFRNDSIEQFGRWAASRDWK